MAQLNSMHSDGKSLSPPFCPAPTRGSLGKSLKAKLTTQRGWSIACFHRSRIKSTHIEGWMPGQPLREDILTSIGLSQDASPFRRLPRSWALSYEAIEW